MKIFLVKKEFEKIAHAFKKRDREIARLEGAIAVLLKSQSQKSLTKSQPVSLSLTKSQRNIETKIINRIRRSKKSFAIEKIKSLMDNHSVIEIYGIIVLDEGICSKASFYRYIQILKSQKEMRLRQN